MDKRGISLLVIAVLGVMSLGLVMLYSTAAYAPDSHGDAHAFLRKQFLWMVIGLVGATVAAAMDYHVWQKLWPWIFALTVVLLICCFLPGIGKRINGSNRWIALGPMTFQPSELAKLAVVTFTATWFTVHEKRSGELIKGFIIPSAIVGVLLVLVVLETDLGSTMLLGLTMFILMFVAGANAKLLGAVTVLAVVGGVFAINQMPERSGRLLAFMDLEKYKEGDGFQQMAGLTAFGSGGMTGLGLGNGRQKLLYLPYAHTDFILPVIGEELGLWATLGLVAAFIVIILSGTFIALSARDRFGMLLGFGFVSLLAIQAGVNIGMTTALLPNKGMPLPFVSYGGSNLSFCLFSIGVLFSIHRVSGQKAPVRVPKVLRARTIRL